MISSQAVKEPNHRGNFRLRLFAVIPDQLRVSIYLFFIFQNIFIQGKTQFSKILFFNAALLVEKLKYKKRDVVSAF